MEHSLAWSASTKWQDGVAGLNQVAVHPGKTFVYVEAKRPGTFMYHPHADEMTQMAMGMMGFWVTHPKNEHPWISQQSILLNAFDIVPGSETPNIMTMLDFNLWAWNSRIFPGIAPLVARNDRVRGWQPHDDKSSNPMASNFLINESRCHNRHRRRTDETNRVPTMIGDDHRGITENKKIGSRLYVNGGTRYGRYDGNDNAPSR